MPPDDAVAPRKRKRQMPSGKGNLHVMWREGSGEDFLEEMTANLGFKE